MQLKKSLIGAVVGGAIGILFLIAAYFLLGTEHTTLAIVVAVLVGLGVRTMVATSGHASYVRGALTALLAIAAFVGGKFIVAEIAVRQMAAGATLPVRVSAPPARQVDQAVESDEPSEETQPEVEVPRQAERPRGAVFRPSAKSAFSTWDFIWLCIAALVAYELGRGSGVAIAPVAPTTSATPA